VELLVAGVLAVVELLDVAAFAIAAPPPATAAVTASVVRIGLIRWLILVHLLWWPEPTIAARSVNFI